MRSARSLAAAVALVAVGLSLIGCSSSERAVTIGINLESSGSIPDVGLNSARAAEMFVESFNETGLELGDETVRLELVQYDNGNTAKGAEISAGALITEEKVLVMVGPNASVGAIEAGGVADLLETPMISPWSTNPTTTEGRRWVFRAAYVDPFQGPVLADFATKEFAVTTACVLYDANSPAPIGQAGDFKAAWEALHGAGSVVAFETFQTGATNFSEQLGRIAAAGCEVFFVPQYYDQTPLIVSQARAAGLTMPILGSDAWTDPKLLEACGADCEGSFYSAHYVANGATGATKAFVDEFTARYGETPSDVAALTWDSMGLVIEGLRNCGELTGDLTLDRACLQDGISTIRDFAGITGNISFGASGDPAKCVVIVKIVDGTPTFYESVCP